MYLCLSLRVKAASRTKLSKSSAGMEVPYITRVYTGATSAQHRSEPGTRHLTGTPSPPLLESKLLFAGMQLPYKTAVYGHKFQANTVLVDLSPARHASIDRPLIG
eukprot:306178-Pelagomonas_calceolata.AAC.3